MIPESIKQKVKKLDEAAKIRENSQKEFLSFCRNKSYPLTDRWRRSLSNFNYEKIRIVNKLSKTKIIKYVSNT